MKLPKVHKSAVCLIPPLQLWSPIQKVRVHRDKSFLRWMPHVNLLYPFHDDKGDSFLQCANEISAALQDIQPFEVTITGTEAFRHGKSSYTVWLKPEPKEALQHLQGRLVETFPDCFDLKVDPGRGITEFTPHLSLGQARNEQEVEQLRAMWQVEGSLTWHVEHVYLISRSGFSDPFTTRYQVPLGGKGSPTRVQLSYAPTVGQLDPPTKSDFVTRNYYVEDDPSVPPTANVFLLHQQLEQLIPDNLRAKLQGYLVNGDAILHEPMDSAKGCIYSLPSHLFADVSNALFEYLPVESGRTVAFVSPPMSGTTGDASIMRPLVNNRTGVKDSKGRRGRGGGRGKKPV